jgi:sarcosine oxidase, subunit beta
MTGARQADVVVVGAGILGCAAACHTAMGGMRTIVVDRGAVGREASGSNAGTLHFQIRPGERATSERLKMIRASVAAWPETAELLGDDIDLHMSGGVMVAETDAEVEFLRGKEDLDRRAGLSTTLWSGTELRSAAPAIGDAVVAATFCAQEGSVNPISATLGYARQAQRAGAEFVQHDAVVELNETADRLRLRLRSGTEVAADKVLIAAGAWSGRVARLAGHNLTVEAKVQIVSVLERSEIRLPFIVQHAAVPLSLKRTTVGTMLVGGGWAGRRRGNLGIPDVDLRALSGNLALACRLVPALAALRLLRSWGGFIPRLESGSPLVERISEQTELYVVVVPVGAAGFTVAPVVAKEAAATLSGVRPVCEAY